MKDVFVRGCRAAPGTGTFIGLKNGKREEIVLEGNHFRYAKEPITGER